jgi:hypothetical protein
MPSLIYQNVVDVILCLYIRCPCKFTKVTIWGYRIFANILVLIEAVLHLVGFDFCFEALTLRKIISHQRPLTLIYDILSLINSVLLTADMILFYMWTKRGKNCAKFMILIRLFIEICKIACWFDTIHVPSDCLSSYYISLIFRYFSCNCYECACPVNTPCLSNLISISLA